MISEELAQKIIRLYHAEKWKVGTIARQLNLHYTTVRRVLLQAGAEVPPKRKHSLVDPYLPFIQEQLERYPQLTASRLYQMVQERGYPGACHHFRAMVRRIRPKPTPEAYLRLRTLPGEQAQVDWGHFGFIQIGPAKRHLSGFVMVLSYSRHIYLCFTYNQKLGAFLQSHVQAFDFFQGVARTLLYDNLKSVVLERIDDAIRFHPEFLKFASHYRFEPRPVAIARGNEKGRVERAIRYIRDNFFAAREFSDLEDLNAQALKWCREMSAHRPCPEDKSMTVGEAFASERPRLLTLPEASYATPDREEVWVGKTPYVRFDLNDYSVPYPWVRKNLTVVADHDTVRILDGLHEIARHARCWSKGQQIEEAAHIAGLVAFKQQARRERGLDRLSHALPGARELLIRIAEHGGNLGSATSALLYLLDTYGAAEVASALAEALAQDARHPKTVRLILEKRHAKKGLPPKIPVPLPDDPRVKNLYVKPHNLEHYKNIAAEENDDNH